MTRIEAIRAAIVRLRNGAGQPYVETADFDALLDLLHFALVEDPDRPRFSDNPDYVRYEALLRQLHALDYDQGAAADAIRDAMDDPEKRLSGGERATLNALSAELNAAAADPR